MDAEHLVRLPAAISAFALAATLAAGAPPLRAQEASPSYGGTPAVPEDSRTSGGDAVQLTSPGTTTVTVGTGEVRSLAGKLEAFGKGLSPEERLMMDWLLQRAGSAPPDDPAGTQVHGTLFTPPKIVSGAADAAGIDSAAAAAEEGAAVDDRAPGAQAPADGGEPTTALSPAPPAALARALGMNLLELEASEGPASGGSQPAR